MSTRVVACLSGGVDSSVAAARLVDAGHDVVGVFMRSGVSAHATGEKQGCCSVEDAADARRVADLLGIPFYALNLEEAFGRVIDRFVDDYARGRTPNPCVLCNRWLKFGHVLEFARQVGAEHVASGHYARVVRRRERWTVARPADRRKDQSYVLAVLEQEQLERVLLPLGETEKAAVREEATRRGLTRVAGKGDSQEICFVAGDYRDLLRERLPEGPPPWPRARSSTPTGACWASTRARPTTRSVSGRASGSPPGSRSTSRRPTPPGAWSWSAPATASIAPVWSPRTPPGWPPPSRPARPGRAEPSSGPTAPAAPAP